MSDTIERATCRGCGRPIFRYVTVNVLKSPLAPETITTWWFHEASEGQTTLTFACEQRAADA